MRPPFSAPIASRLLQRSVAVSNVKHLVAVDTAQQPVPEDLEPCGAIGRRDRNALSPLLRQTGGR